MNKQFIKTFALGASAAMMLFCSAAYAQGPGGPSQGGGQGGFRQPPPFLGGQGPEQGQRPPRPAEISPVSIPIDTLASALKLSGDQRTKIAAIQAKIESVRQALGVPPEQSSNRQRPGAGQGGGLGQGGPQDQNFGGPPRPIGFGGAGGRGQIPTGDVVDDLSADASDKIVGVLDSQQQGSLMNLIHRLRDLRLAGIDPGSYASLNLSTSQMDKISNLAAAQRVELLKTVENEQSQSDTQSSLQQLRHDLHKSAVALLTDDQAAIVRAQRPNLPGGFGGQGGPGGQSGQGGPGGQSGQGGFGGPDGQMGFGGPRGPGGFGGDSGPGQGGPGGPGDQQAGGPPPGF